MTTSLRASLAPEDTLLLGTDLVKDPGLMIAAYDDSAGVTAALRTCPRETQYGHHGRRRQLRTNGLASPDRGNLFTEHLLDHVAGHRDPHECLARLLSVLAPGGYLALSHL